MRLDAHSYLRENQIQVSTFRFPITQPRNIMIEDTLANDTTHLLPSPSVRANGDYIKVAIVNYDSEANHTIQIFTQLYQNSGVMIVLAISSVLIVISVFM
ncbi:hypothetical protein FGO68_gene11788 [Halteria grandinella]|uniref:Uncharacterized protein n=1 Tax=Halteria grandinella TaxID=5974 RepID=A0A8J8NJC9_HALGN|nr:hypothetical protein FGO68_gene11788 [Halteria grandinella]